MSALQLNGIPTEEFRPDGPIRTLEQRLVAERRELEERARQLDEQDAGLWQIHCKLTDIAQRFGMQSLEEVETFVGRRFLPLLFWQIWAIMGTLGGFIFGYWVGFSR